MLLKASRNHGYIAFGGLNIGFKRNTRYLYLKTLSSTSPVFRVFNNSLNNRKTEHGNKVTHNT